MFDPSRSCSVPDNILETEKTIIIEFPPQQLGILYFKSLRKNTDIRSYFHFVGRTYSRTRRYPQSLYPEHATQLVLRRWWLTIHRSVFDLQSYEYMKNGAQVNENHSPNKFFCFYFVPCLFSFSLRFSSTFVTASRSVWS